MLSRAKAPILSYAMIADENGTSIIDAAREINEK